MVDAQATEIYDILGQCSSEVLGPVVDRLIAFPVSLITLTRAYELHQPDHAQYADRIGDEVYRLAMIAMASKDRRRPSYDAMIEAVCRKIGIPIAPSDAKRNEGALFSVLAPRHLASISPADFPAAVDAICAAGAQAVDGMLTDAAWPAFAAALLHLGFLRRMVLSMPSLPAVADGSSSDDESGSIIVMADDGSPILSLASHSDNASARWKSLDHGDGLLTTLTPILKAIEPFIAADKLIANGNYVRVGIEGGAAALSRSKATGMMVGTATGHKGMVPFLPAAAGAVAWPTGLLLLATSYLEQKRFEDIERRLGEIKAALEDVGKFQRAERRSVLTGSIRYFRQVAPAVLSGELDQEVVQEVEDHEADLVRVQDHVSGEIDAQIAAMQALRNEGWSSAKFTKSLGESTAQFARLMDEAALCVRARACAYQLLCAFPGRERRKRARRDDIAEALQRLCGDVGVGQRLDALLREKLQNISSFEAKGFILGNAGVLLDAMAAIRSDILTGLRESEADPTQTTEPISFAIRFANGQPVAVAAA